MFSTSWVTTPFISYRHGQLLGEIPAYIPLINIFVLFLDRVQGLQFIYFSGPEILITKYKVSSQIGGVVAGLGWGDSWSASQLEWTRNKAVLLLSLRSKCV